MLESVLGQQGRRAVLFLAGTMSSPGSARRNYDNMAKMAAATRRAHVEAEARAYYGQAGAVHVMFAPDSEPSSSSHRRRGESVALLLRETPKGTKCPHAQRGPGLCVNSAFIAGLSDLTGMQAFPAALGRFSGEPIDLLP